MASSINASTTAGLVNTADTSGVLQLQTAGTTAISIDASQAVTMAGTLAVTGTMSSVGDAAVGTAGGTRTLTIGSTSSTGAGFINLVTSSAFKNWQIASNQYVASALSFTPSTATGGTTFTTPTLNILDIGLSTLNIGVGGTTPTSSGAGITFPTTQSASTNANTLDDYEEGTITSLTDGSGAGLSITFNNAKYTKIGRLVYISISTIEYPVTANTAPATIAGLPFVNTAADVGSSTLISNNAFSNRALVVANASTIYFYPTSSAGQALNNQLSGTAIYGFSAVYQTS